MTAAALTQTPAASSGDGVARPTLLFVDDEERILRSLRMLFAANYRVLITTSGHDALEILRQIPVQVLVSDQRMPAMTGVELLRRAREVSPTTMRVLLTGYADLEAIIGSINDGEVFRYINKPWNADEIRRLVGEAADIALSLVQAAGSAPRLAAPGHTPEILLVDQSPEVAETLRLIVEEGFPGIFRFEWATSLAQVMAVLERGGVSIIISDLRVGNEDMTPVLKTLKRFHPEVVTLVMTSLQDTSTLMGLINQGQIHRFLPKPMRRTVTLRAIQSGLDRHREIRLRPELGRRHCVEAPPADVPATLVNRIRGLFGRLGNPRTAG